MWGFLLQRKMWKFSVGSFITARWLPLPRGVDWLSVLCAAGWCLEDPPQTKEQSLHPPYTDHKNLSSGNLKVK